MPEQTFESRRDRKHTSSHVPDEMVVRHAGSKLAPHHVQVAKAGLVPPRAPGRDLIVEAYAEIFAKLFCKRPDDKLVYDQEFAVLTTRFNATPQQLINKAVGELLRRSAIAKFDEQGRISNSEEIGKYFEAVNELANKYVNLAIINTEKRALNAPLYIPYQSRAALLEIVANGEACMIYSVRQPPRSAAQEIVHISEEKLHGLMAPWSNPELRKHIQLSPELKHYLQHATVRVMCTGENRSANLVAKKLNEELERQGGFEDKHWLRIINAVAHQEKQESLKSALKACVPVIIGVKALESFYPHLLHTVGGMLDDLFGAIIPDVSQSWGANKGNMLSKLKSSAPVLVAGAISIPLSLLFGYQAAQLYAGTQSTGAHMLAGAMFALACSVGTLFTSAGAMFKSWQAHTKLERDKQFKGLVEKQGTWDKLKSCFKESILGVPFRIGHTVIGVPFQIGLGVAAGAFGFFHNSGFVMMEGMAETLLGVATAFLYPHIAEKIRSIRFSRK